MNPDPQRNGKRGLKVSNMYPAKVGAIDPEAIRKKPLIPTAVAVSSGSTILAAKDCRMGFENRCTTLIAIMRVMANGNQLLIGSATVRPEARSRQVTIIFISPNRSTILGRSRRLRMERNLVAA